MAEAAEKAAMLVNRVRKNRKRLRAWSRREAVTCLRLYDRDIPEIPLAVDWYDGRLHVAEYKVQRELPAGWALDMARSLGRALGVDDELIFVKERRRQRGLSQYQRAGSEGATFVVEEGGYRFRVNLSDYLDTGLFLDHRSTRKRVESEAADKDVLNLFCYTGAFSVYAAGGGATSTTSVDMSKTYTAWAEDNLRLNRARADRHQVVRADVLAWLERARPRSFDLAVVDPPTFSNSKRMAGSFDVQRDHVSLIEGVVRLLRPGGVCYFSTNHRRFRFDADSLSHIPAEDLSESTVPPDFRNRRIHRCYRLGPVAL